MTKLSCNDLGIENCDFVAASRDGDGEEVVNQMVKHLRQQHSIRLATKDVFEGDLARMDEAERMVTARIRGELHLQPE